ETHALTSMYSASIEPIQDRGVTRTGFFHRRAVPYRQTARTDLPDAYSVAPDFLESVVDRQRIAAVCAETSQHAQSHAAADLGFEQSVTGEAICTNFIGKSHLMKGLCRLGRRRGFFGTRGFD